MLMSHASPLIQEDILAYLKQHESKQLLRFMTCGSVDDGKSTLIGRLLHDSQMIYEDQLAAVRRDSKTAGTQAGELDLALLVDGLQAEREQGITIDVAYRYFSTAKRKFIIADTPGHEQYTRNMATGASNCDVAIILVDAVRGVQPQTRRHSFICSLLGIKQVIVAVNKMDAVGFAQARYKEIQADYLALAGALDIPDIRFVPISALAGDNVVHYSDNMPWFRGSPLMHYLETLDIARLESDEFRFPVQWVNRPSSEFRGYAGSVLSGAVRVGDTVRVLPSGQLSSVKQIYTFDGSLEVADAGQAVTLLLNDELDVSRGDMLVHKDRLPHVASRLRAKLVWMHDEPLSMQREYYFKFPGKTVLGEVQDIRHRIDVNTMQEHAAGELGLNEIGEVDVQLQQRVMFDAYGVNRPTGGFVMIDRLSNMTVAAGMISEPLVSAAGAELPYTPSEQEIELNKFVRKHYPHWGAKDITR